MVQLAFPVSEAAVTLAALLESLERQARRSAGEGRHLHTAVSATWNAFDFMARRPLTQTDRRRVRAYFNAVLRRQVLGSREESARTARARLVAVSLEADLRAAGWSRSQARAEVDRVLGVSIREGAA
jgi:hypothetical protein